MLKIDMNCDMAESYGAYRIGRDGEILPHITSANLACGFHASDPLIMANAVEACAKNGVAVGAHPGYPDLQGFGRRNMIIPPAEVKAMAMYQIGALDAFCRANGIRMQHVKPHGAMYNMAVKDHALAIAIAEAVAAVDPGLILLAPAGSQLQIAAQEVGVPFAREVFADRAYEEDGSLVARGRPGAMITDENEAVERVIRMVKEGRVTAISGREIDIRADSVCVHGDGEKALLFVEKLRAALAGEGIEIRALK